MCETAYVTSVINSKICNTVSMLIVSMNCIKSCFVVDFGIKNESARIFRHEHIIFLSMYCVSIQGFKVLANFQIPPIMGCRNYLEASCEKPFAFDAVGKWKGRNSQMWQMATKCK